MGLNGWIMDIIHPIHPHSATLSWIGKISAPFSHTIRPFDKSYFFSAHLVQLSLESSYRMKQAEKQYMDAFNDELNSFKERIRGRAKARVDAYMEEVEEVGILFIHL